MAKKQSVHADASLATQLIAGTQKHLASGGQLPLASGATTAAQLTTQLQAIVQLRSDVDAAKAQTAAKLAAWHAQMPALRIVMDALVAYVRAIYASAPDVLADFGLKPKKARTPLTIAAKAAAAAKRAATRAARHVMGSVQRKAVKGDVASVVVTPVVAPQPVAATSNGTSPPAPTAGGATTVPTGHTA
jgi:hypothetical protein